MKKIKSLFLALLAMMLAVPSLHAQGNYIIGAPVALEDELDGLEVVFEGYSDDSKPRRIPRESQGSKRSGREFHTHAYAL